MILDIMKPSFFALMHLGGAKVWQNGKVLVHILKPFLAHGFILYNLKDHENPTRCVVRNFLFEKPLSFWWIVLKTTQILIHLETPKSIIFWSLWPVAIYLSDIFFLYMDHQRKPVTDTHTHNICVRIWQGLFFLDDQKQRSQVCQQIRPWQIAAKP